MPHAKPPFSEALQRLGFKKWHERQLLAGHAHLVLALLCMLGFLGAFEALGRLAEGRWLNLLWMAVCGAIGVWAVRQYAERLGRAERVSLQATCPHCGSYGRLRCVIAHPQGVDVACRVCTQRWTIEG